MSELPKDKLVSISKAAEILGVSIDTIRRWDKAGTLKSERPNGKDRFFNVEDLEAHKFSKPLSISQASEQLGISVTTLRRLEKKGLIKPERNANGERTYDKKALENFLRSEYFMQQRKVEEKVLEPFATTEKTNEEVPAENVDESIKVINTVVKSVDDRVRSLTRFQNALRFSGLFLASSAVLIILTITVLFFLFPKETAKLLGYEYSPANAKISYSNPNVLAARTQPSRSVLGSFVRPFSQISLAIVQQIDPKVYESIVSKPKIRDVNNILSVDKNGEIIPLVPIKLPNITYLQVESATPSAAPSLITQVINNQNAGNFAILQPDGTIQGLNVANGNILPGVVSASKLQDASVTSAKIADGAVTLAKLGSDVSLSLSFSGTGEVKSADIADGAVTSAKISDGTISANDISSSLIFGNGTYIDLSAVTHSTSSLQGLRLPNVSSSSPTGPSSGKGFIAYDTADSQVIYYNGSAWKQITGVTLTSSGASSNTSSNSGLELDSSSNLSLLRGCADGQIVKWSGGSSVWQCANDLSGGAGSSTIQLDYNNSTSPELVVNSTNGALTIRDAATPIGANLLEVQNNGGTSTYLSVTTSGVTGSSLTSNSGLTVSAGTVSLPSGSIATSALASSSTTFAGNTGSGGISLGGTINIQGAGINNAVYSAGTITITGTEADTLSSVTGRGASTTTAVSLNGGLSSTVSSSTNNASIQSTSFTNSSSAGAVTVNGLSITPNGTVTSGTNTLNSILLNAPATPNSNTFQGINIGTGYSDILRYNNTQLISGLGIVQSAAISGSYTGIAGVGTLTAGALGSGFSTIGVGQGGTGVTTFGGTNTILYTSSANTLSSITAGTDGQILLGRTTASPIFATMSGDATISNSGVISIGTGKVTSAMILDGTIAGGDLAGNIAIATTGGISSTEKGNTATDFGLYLKRNADVSPAGYLIQAQNNAGNSNLFTVDTLGNVVANNISSGATVSGTNTGDQTITLTGDVTGSGTGSFAATIGSGAVSLSKMANLAANSIIGNNTASAATPLALTAAQVKSLLAIANTDVSGLGTMSTQNSNAVSISGGTISGLSSLGVSGAATITSTSANALAVGANGTINPAFNIDASTLSSATGLNVKSAAAAGGVALSAISSGLAEDLNISAKGTGKITLGSGSTGNIQFFGSSYGITSAGALTVASCTGCGASGSTTLNNVTAATAASTINNGDNAIVWNWDLTTAGKSAFTFGENVAGNATGTPFLVNIQTLSTSTVNPLVVTAGGTANGVKVDTTGALSAIGTGGIQATSTTSTISISTSGNIATTGTGTITSAGLLTASNGFTLSAGTLTLPAASVADSALSSNVALKNTANIFTNANTIQSGTAGLVGLTIKGKPSDTANTLEIFDSAVTPARQAFFDSTGALTLGKSLTASGGVTLTCTACITDTNVADALTISGGTVNNSVIGGTSAATGTFTTLTANTSITSANLTTAGVVTNTSAGVLGTLAGTTTTVLHGNAAGLPTFGAIVNGDLTAGSYSNITGVGTLAALAVTSTATSGTIVGLTDTSFTADASKLLSATVTNASTAVGATAVSGLDLTLATGTNTNNSNTVNGINFPAATITNSNTINGINFVSATGFTNFLKTPSFVLSNTGAISGVTTLGLSGAISGPTATNTINGIIINSSAVSNVTTLGLSGAITGATSTNTINGLVINSGALSSVSTINMSGQLTSTVSTGTAPLVVASTTNVANLNASSLNGATFAAPGTIGGTTPGAATFTTVTTNTSVTDVGLSTAGVVTNTSGGLLGTLAGTTTTVLHGNTAGLPAFGAVTGSDLASNIAVTTTGVLTQNFSSSTDAAKAYALNVTNSSGAGVVTVNGLVYTPTGTATTGTNTINGINFAAPVTPNSNNFYGLNFSTGYADILRYNGNQLISGTGIVQSAAVSGSYTGITGVGTLTAGSLGAGFTTVAVARGGTGVTTFGGANTILYTTAADTLSSIASANNGVLVTSAGGVPSISSTLPTAVQNNITSVGTLGSLAVTGTIASSGSSLGAFNTTENLSVAGTVNGVTSAVTLGGTAAANAYTLNAFNVANVAGSCPVGATCTNNGLFFGTGLTNYFTDSAGTTKLTSGGALTLAGTITANTANTINSVSINAGAVSGVTTLGLSGAISGATAINTINGLIISSGALSGISTINASGQFTSTVTTGTAPFVVSSTTNVANLNASSLNGATFAAPGAIGGTTPGTGTFTTISASSTITGTTLNGTTGINTGASAGTQRIDATGNLVSIGNITGTGAVILNTTGNTNGVTINTATGASGNSGAITIQTGGTTTSGTSGNVAIDVGAGATSNGTVTIGGTNASGLTIGRVTVTTTVAGTLSSTGGISLAANQGLTFLSGTGTLIQNYSNTSGTQATFNHTNSGSSGTNTSTVLSLAITGTANGTGSNTITGINFPNVTAQTNNTYNGITFGTGFNNFLTSGTVNITAAGAISGVTTLGLSGAITGATATNTINGLIVNSGALSGITTINASGQITSTVTTGTAPFVVSSTTNVANLNASSLNGATFAAPGSIGAGTPGTGAFTTLTASSTITGTSNSASALAVGANGATNPVLQVDASTVSVATGLKILGAATGGTTALSAIDSGLNTSLSLSGKGTGTVTLASGSTGDIQFFSASNKITSAGALTVAGAITAPTTTNTINGLIINSGVVTGGTYNGLTLTSAADGFTVAGGTTSRTLTVTGANITVGSTITPTAAGALSITTNGAANNLTLNTANATSANSGAITIQSGTTTTSGTTGNVTLDVGSGVALGSVSIGGTVASSVNVGTSTGAAHTITIGETTNGATAVNINSGVGYTIAGGTGVISLKGGAAADVTTLTGNTGLTILPASGTGATGGAVNLTGGVSSAASGTGGGITITGGDATGATTVTGGSVTIAGKTPTGAGTKTGGSVNIDAGTGGTNGTIQIGNTNATNINVGTATGAKTITIGETGATGNTIAIGTGTGADTINIGTGGTGVDNIAIGSTANSWHITSAGALTVASCTGCGASGSTTLNNVTAATAASTINNGDNAIVWNWDLTTAGKSAFTFGENVAGNATGTPFLVNIQTLSTSTVNPLVVTAGGTANGVKVDTTGALSAIGTGSINANNVATTQVTTNASFFPLFVSSSANGNQAVNLAASGLTFNPSTGTLTATGFSGPLTGNVTGNVSGSAATVTGAAQTAITSLGTLTGLTVTGTITTNNGSLGALNPTENLSAAGTVNGLTITPTLGGTAAANVYTFNALNLADFTGTCPSTATCTNNYIKSTNFTVSSSGSITAATSSTINGVSISSGAVSGVTTLGLSGAISGATATNTINGLIINSSALSNISTISMSGQLTSSLATGTAPFSVASTTNVANLNASSLNGATFAAPGAIGSGTPGAGTFTTLTAQTSVTSGTTTVGGLIQTPINNTVGSDTGLVINHTGTAFADAGDLLLSLQEGGVGKFSVDRTGLITTASVNNASVAASAGIVYSKLSLTGSIVGGDLASNIAISTTGNIATTGTGTITSAGLLTASNGLTLSAGTLTLPSASIADAALSTNVALLNSIQTFTAAKTFATATATDDTLSLNPATGGAARFNGSITSADLTAARTYTLPDAGGTFAVSATNPITLSAAGAIGLNTASANDTNATTSNNSGLIVTTNGVGLLRGCSDTQILKWTLSTGVWGCAADATTSGGTTVNLDPAAAQASSANSNSIFINRTALGSLLNLTQNTTLAAAYTGDDSILLRNLVGGTNAQGGSYLHIKDTSGGSGTINPTGLLVEVATPATTTLYTGNFIDLKSADTAGGATTSKFTVSSAGVINNFTGFNSSGATAQYNSIFNVNRNVVPAASGVDAGSNFKLTQTGGGDANSAAAGLIGSYDITGGSANHTAGILGYNNPTTGGSGINIGVEGHAWDSIAAKNYWGVRGKSSLNNVTSNSGTTSIGLVGESGVFQGTTTGATMVGGWLRAITGETTAFTNTGVNGTILNAVLGDAVTNYPTLFRGQINAAEANAAFTITDGTTDKLVLDLTDNIPNGLKIKLADAAGTANVAIHSSTDANIFSVNSLGNFTASGLGGVRAATRPDALLNIGGGTTYGGSGTVAVGEYVDYSTGAAATLISAGNLIQMRTDASVFTLSNLVGNQVSTPVKGAGSIITNAYGFKAETMNVASTNNYGLYIDQPSLVAGIGSTTDSIGFDIPTNTAVSMGDQIATTANAFGIKIGKQTYTSTTNVRTLTNAASLYIEDAPAAGANVTMTNTPYALQVANGKIKLTDTLTSDATTVNSLDFSSVINAAAGAGVIYGANFSQADNSTNTGVVDAIVRVQNANAAETTADGLLVEQTGAGTLTSGLEVKQTAGAITTGLKFTGTFTNFIDTPLSVFKVANSGAISAPTATNTINGIVINSGALSSVTTLGLSGAITGATATNTINGIVINSGAISSVSTLGLSGAITGATATNTINGLIINSGALSGITTFSAAATITSSGASVGSITPTANLSATGNIAGLAVTPTRGGTAAANTYTINGLSFAAVAGTCPSTATCVQNGINFTGTGYTVELSLQNGATIDNATAGQLLLTATTIKTSGNLTVGTSGTGTISSGAINGETLTSAADGFTVAGGTTSRTLTVTGANITVGSTITPTSAGALTVQSNGANTLTLDAGGLAGLTVGTTNANAVTISKSGVSTTIQGTTTSNGALTVGTGGNTFTFDPASGPAYAGTARPDRRVTLTPEYAGAVLTGTGTGTMTSDFCAASAGAGGLPATNTTVCNTSGDVHNYYNWTTSQGTAQTYSVWVRWRVPDNFNAWDSSNPIQVYAKRSDATNGHVNVKVFDTANALNNTGGTEVAGAANTWVQNSVSITGGTWTAGSYVTFEIDLTAAATSGITDVGEINLNYLTSN